MLINETNNSMEIRSINIMNYKGISVLFEKIKFKNNCYSHFYAHFLQKIALHFSH